MNLYNKTQNKLIIQNIKVGQNNLSKLIGLIGKNKSASLYLTTRFGIHTFGMKFALTILVCDRRNNQLIIKKIKTKLDKNNFYFYSIKYKHIIELPYRHYDVKIGDILLIY